MVNGRVWRYRQTHTDTRFGAQLGVPMHTHTCTNGQNGVIDSGANHTNSQTKAAPENTHTEGEFADAKQTQST